FSYGHPDWQETIEVSATGSSSTVTSLGPQIPTQRKLIHPTSLLCSRGQLWVGTNIGVICSMPFTWVLSPQDRIEDSMSEDDYSLFMAKNMEISADSLSKEGRSGLATTEVAYVSCVEPAYAQISQHAHGEDVRFLLQVRSQTETEILVLTGAQGYTKMPLKDSGEKCSMDDQTFMLAWKLPPPK
ncbi:hypothetical protein Ciccas_000987, partial [Cichlidogyrus casuarinus]